MSNEEDQGVLDIKQEKSYRLPTNTVQCDGEFPCKRCKDDGLVCTAGVRKKMEYKQLPRGYVQEVNLSYRP